MDKARKKTDKQLEKMERDIENIYYDNYAIIAAGWYAYMKINASKLEEAHASLQVALQGGDAEAIKKAHATYEKTARGITLNSTEFKKIVNQTTTKLAQVNQAALTYVNANLTKIYTWNYNAFAEYKVENYAFKKTTEKAVDVLMKSKKLLLPKKLDIPKDKRWNTKIINSQIAQGIAQGESIPKISNRIFPEIMNKSDFTGLSEKEVAGLIKKNEQAAVRNARTMVTAAENQGRQDSFEKAVADGVIMTRVWVATLDERTRAWHADLHGVEAEIDEPWENEYGEIMKPGDPDADPANVYNCRCGMKAEIKGFKWKE